MYSKAIFNGLFINVSINDRESNKKNNYSIECQSTNCEYDSAK